MLICHGGILRLLQSAPQFVLQLASNLILRISTVDGPRASAVKSMNFGAFGSRKVMIWEIIAGALQNALP